LHLECILVRRTGKVEPELYKGGATEFKTEAPPAASGVVVLRKRF